MIVFSSHVDARPTQRRQELTLCDCTWLSQLAWLANLTGVSFGRALSAAILYPKKLNNWLEAPVTCPQFVGFLDEENMRR